MSDEESKWFYILRETDSEGNRKLHYFDGQPIPDIVEVTSDTPTCGFTANDMQSPSFTLAPNVVVVNAISFSRRDDPDFVDRAPTWGEVGNALGVSRVEARRFHREYLPGRVEIIDQSTLHRLVEQILEESILFKNNRIDESPNASSKMSKFRLPTTEHGQFVFQVTVAGGFMILSFIAGAFFF